MRKFRRNDFPGAGSAENHGVGHIAVMKIQVVGRVVVGLENREIFLREDAALRGSPQWSVKRNEKSA